MPNVFRLVLLGLAASLAYFAFTHSPDIFAFGRAVLGSAVCAGLALMPWREEEG